MTTALPRPLVERLQTARRVVELAAGSRFETALAIHEAAPQARVLVTDIDERVLQAPAPLSACTLDVTRPHPGPLAGSDLMLAVRVPEELQRPCALLARAMGADLALRAFKDEWADVSDVVGPPIVWPDGWRYHPANT